MEDKVFSILEDKVISILEDKENSIVEDKVNINLEDEVCLFSIAFLLKGEPLLSNYLFLQYSHCSFLA